MWHSIFLKHSNQTCQKYRSIQFPGYSFSTIKPDMYKALGTLF